MYKSVYDNKGFYISRFEAGKQGLTSTLVSKKNVSPYNQIKWGKSMTDETGGAVEKARSFVTQEGYTNLTSTLCYGVQWDAIMRYLSDVENTNVTGEKYIQDSTGMGNYSGNIINTGTNDDYKVKNIYDLAGNVSEWTMEIDNVDSSISNINTKRILRGAYFNNDSSENPATWRTGDAPTVQDRYIGFRIALYINPETSEEMLWSPEYDKTSLYTDENGEIAYIPEGFKVSQLKSENTVKNGLVVKDKKDNEFVWIPVNDSSNFVREFGYKRGVIDDIDGSFEFTSIQPELNKYYEADGSDINTESGKMYSSVRKYKGFYIMRYEAGCVTQRTTPGQAITEIPYSKKGLYSYNNIGWSTTNSDITNEEGGAVEVARNFATAHGYSDTSAKSTLCYSVQWDSLVRFIKDVKNTHANNKQCIQDSTGLGNYSGVLATKTGSNENYKIKNMYDIAGNGIEWVMETSHTSYKVNRGGWYGVTGDEYPVSSRNDSWPADCGPEFAFRVTLYI